MGVDGTPISVERASRDILGFSLFHGPGESVANRGDGRGVTLPMAAMTGLGNVELVADALPNAYARLLVLRLGVLDNGWSDEAEDRSRKPGGGRFIGVAKGSEQSASG